MLSSRKGRIMKKLITLLLLISSPAFADSAITVRTGDVVGPSFDKGTLLDAPQARKIQDQLIERDALQKENESFQRSVELFKENQKLYQEENTLLLNRNIEVTRALNDARSTSDWVKGLYFVLGLGVMYGGYHLAK